MRFTLAACLALMALAAVICFLLTTKPSVVSYVLLMGITIFVPIAALAGIVYGRDNLRAFCIGAIFPLALLVWASSQHIQAITLDPQAYGWPAPAQTLALSTIYVNEVNWNVSGRQQTDSFEFPSNPYAFIAPPYGATISRATAMTNPTCTLSIAAILGGVLVMAIRGGLKRNEPIAGENPGG